MPAVVSPAQLARERSLVTALILDSVLIVVVLTVALIGGSLTMLAECVRGILVGLQQKLPFAIERDRRGYFGGSSRFCRLSFRIRGVNDGGCDEARESQSTEEGFCCVHKIRQRLDSCDDGGAPFILRPGAGR